MVSAAMITGTLALTTAIVPDWIELVFGWDHHDGSVERWLVIWLITAALGFVGPPDASAAMQKREHYRMNCPLAPAEYHDRALGPGRVYELREDCWLVPTMLAVGCALVWKRYGFA